MAKKKNQSKKHRFKYASASEATTPVVATSSGNGVAKTDVPKRAASANATVRDFTYVGQDLRRITVLAASLVALEVVLWYVFGHTSLGNTIYNLVQV